MASMINWDNISKISACVLISYTLICIRFCYGMYSRVPNKRGGVRIIGGGWKWFDITIIGGVGMIGGGCFEKLKIVVFLGKHVSLIYLCEQLYY